MKKRIAAIAMAGVTRVSVIATSPGANAVSNASWSSGKVTRAVLWENYNGGHKLTVLGTGNCTASTSDADTVMSWMGDRGWNDVVSGAQDFAGCDVDLFTNLGYGGVSTGYVNYGQNIGYVGASLNDRASSFKIS
ncbi:hypothetical protein [Acidipropionibacterium thoenii]|uniref:hypothetical protein n=1 Tax=Acidipropionibacterium thoenii TaxID=1751 RepID=UPI0012B54A5F|nr:hypothetical protein [Acidipropionibacterium thoenii]